MCFQRLLCNVLSWALEDGHQTDRRTDRQARKQPGRQEGQTDRQTEGQTGEQAVHGPSQITYVSQHATGSVLG